MTQLTDLTTKVFAATYKSGTPQGKIDWIRYYSECKAFGMDPWHLHELGHSFRSFIDRWTARASLPQAV